MNPDQFGGDVPPPKVKPVKLEGGARAPHPPHGPPMVRIYLDLRALCELPSL